MWNKGFNSHHNGPWKKHMKIEQKLNCKSKGEKSSFDQSLPVFPQHIYLRKNDF